MLCCSWLGLPDTNSLSTIPFLSLHPINRLVAKVWLLQDFTDGKSCSASLLRKHKPFLSKQSNWALMKTNPFSTICYSFNWISLISAGSFNSFVDSVSWWKLELEKEISVATGQDSSPAWYVPHHCVKTGLIQTTTSCLYKCGYCVKKLHDYI